MRRAESLGAGPSGTPARTAADRDGEAMMIPGTYGYARVSKSDRDDRNLETQLRELANHGIRKDLIFSDVMTGRLMSRPGWGELMARVQPSDTIVVVWLDRFSRNFDEGVRIQADLTGRGIGIVAIKEGIDTTDDGAAAKYFRRMILANGAYQADSTSERIKVGQERAKAEGRPPGRPPALSPRPGERVQAYVRREPIREPCGQDHEDIMEYGQQGNLRSKFSTSRNAMTGGSRPVCDCPEPCAWYAGGKDKAFQTAVAPKGMDHDDQFDRRDGIAVGQRFSRRIFLPGGHGLQGRRTPDKPQGKRDGLRQSYSGLLGAGQAVGPGQRCRESAGRRLLRPRRRPGQVAVPRQGNRPRRRSHSPGSDGPLRPSRIGPGS